MVRKCVHLKLENQTCSVLFATSGAGSM